MQKRRYPIGAECVPGGGVSFRVWAPRRRRVEAVLDGSRCVDLRADGAGYFAGVAREASSGTRYRFRLDGGGQFPDPASRYQPEGPHGPSEVVDAARFEWTDGAWPGIGRSGQVIYEMHIGTFTREGTWDSARRQLPELAALGITAVELMPACEFSGAFGWGYDGVGWFAPYHHYGEPDDLRRFVDDAHRAGVGVLLDVVYNHFGPDGNYLREFSEHYFTDRYPNEWGDAINFDGPESGPVREFVCANAAYWADEFHFDGLRLDATQQIYDASPRHIVSDVAKSFRRGAHGRKTLITAEIESQRAILARPEAQGGYGVDSMWNDDFHHTARVAATGHFEAYYGDYRGTPQELISALKYGFLFQGQYYQWQKQSRGTPAWGLHPEQFILYLENHDQIANSGRGERLDRLTTPGRLRALTALVLLAPGTPLLFQGQEFAASAPFLYFADHHGELGEAVRKGRHEFYRQFPPLAQPAMESALGDPADPATFERCKLDLTERETHAPVYRLHRDLLRLRREDPVFRAPEPRGVDGAVLGPEAFLLRFFETPGAAGDDRLLLVNLGRDLPLTPAPEPLLAPPEGARWQILWASEEPAYGGSGAPPWDHASPRLPGHAALVLVPWRK